MIKARAKKSVYMKWKLVSVGAYVCFMYVSINLNVVAPVVGMWIKNIGIMLVGTEASTLAMRKNPLHTKMHMKGHSSNTMGP